jgi:hypothetical protein
MDRWMNLNIATMYFVMFIPVDLQFRKTNKFLFIMHFIIMFLSLINLMINKYTSYVIILRGSHTAARKHPTEKENGPHCNKC